jgi:hypothetical protein
MALRTFVDSKGREWQAFDVIPRVVERRAYDRRAGASAVPGVAERRDADRRVSVGRRSALAALSAGWLCFEPTRGTERRRLSPIPADWRQCSDSSIERYCAAARVVPEAASLGELASREH